MKNGLLHRVVKAQGALETPIAAPGNHSSLLSISIHRLHTLHAGDNESTFLKENKGTTVSMISKIIKTIQTACVRQQKMIDERRIIQTYGGSIQNNFHYTSVTALNSTLKACVQ